ncbi:PEP/pyruvate-binding domain-containing protein [Paenibacillus aurantius]|uniref:Phosphoenolpyruvate synthase n=1 Tax=Paenibacillus aurantius TaxID=2918900 RepID=A0AA96RH53_9BACL|nr:PEP/pyruvate-binding domain-containing protein [Paenibacillus aurantius]WNQ13196.1 PEP/pyruvate-binding domain-containing protein [Paenibacillus aurantius]
MLVLAFNEVGLGQLERVGGKGANLGEMVKAGLPVPPGFCITTEAYIRFLDGAGLRPAVQDILNSVQVGDLADLKNKANQIQTLMEAAPIPWEVKEAIQAAYQTMGNPPVAVRSSATAEDLPDASFAGQQETFLNITDEIALLEHVRRCWASLWTPRSLSYRERSGFAHDKVHLAVVVQQMVDPDAASVLFTANPLTGGRNEMVINASYGLGESIVSGQVNPDTYRLTKQKSPQLLEQLLGDKQILIQSVPGGGTVEKPVMEADRIRFCLNREDLNKIARLGLQVESYYGSPQDIEWAMVDDRLYLLQARPITTLKQGGRYKRFPSSPDSNDSC